MLRLNLIHVSKSGHWYHNVTTTNKAQHKKMCIFYGIYRNSSITVSAMVSQITGYQLFTPPFVQVQIKEKIKAPRHWPL